jgi:murein DD-endopeptidase MepM/ murein hydrolase activator NlpD
MRFLQLASLTLLALMFVVPGLSVSAAPALAYTTPDQLEQPADQPANQQNCRSFPETGFEVCGRLLEYWQQNNGLRVFGLPITAQYEATIEGQPLQVQWFERNRLELHPENAPPYDVLLGRLGVDGMEQMPADAATSELPGACARIPGAQHDVCGTFLTAWRASGLNLDDQVGTSEAESLALFGLPLSAPYIETLQGQEYIVQWFERARFEYHPQNEAPYDVLFGLLGSEVGSQLGIVETVPESQASPAIPAMRYVFPIRAEQVEYGRYHHDYPATDIFCPIGSDFLATTSGVVDFVSKVDQWDPATNRPEHRGGIAIAIIGDDGIRYYGSHLSGIAEGIAVGERVEAGQLLGWTGKSGNARSTPPHVHYGISHPTTPDDWETRRGEVWPYEYLKAWERGEMVTPRLD